ncbi:MAG: amidohydrolase, partial [Acidobacteriota bacterium]|nr:amidohydrolase [Acidobacteriota bacterium]
MNSLRTRWSFLIPVSLLALGLAVPLAAQEPIPYPVPDRTDGEGPWDRVILRGPIVIDGTGAPPYGPVDIIVEGNIIRSIHNVGTGVTPIHEEDRPVAQPGDEEIRLEGHYILPGFLDMHLHQHYEGEGQRVPTE